MKYVDRSNEGLILTFDMNFPNFYTEVNNALILCVFNRELAFFSLRLRGRWAQGEWGNIKGDSKKTLPANVLWIF